MHNAILKEMWRNRAVATAWLEYGGKWMSMAFPLHFMVLAATKHRWTDFRWALDMAKCDKAFVVQAI